MAEQQADARWTGELEGSEVCSVSKALAATEITLDAELASG